MRKSNAPNGLTMIELAIVIAILAIALCGSLSLFNYCYDSITRARNTADAVTEAQTKLEQIRSADYHRIATDYPVGIVYPVPNLPGGTSTVAIVYGPIAGTNSELLEAAVTVSWLEKGGGARSLSLATMIANRY
ncbi:MAG: prepilin-type N-terminal cleavage/methylation domain-containing protein [Candidatus Omnitrophota bacterium]